MPHVFVLLTMVVFVCTILTYIVPSGKFERETKKVGTLTRTVVVPNTYQEIPKHYSIEGLILGDEKEGKASPVSLFGFLSSIPKGMK
ncbi:MAG: hypothetical protein KJO59_02420, partial [Ignavibacteria bacterium]|nr:hypothetical protein [Ignavibacteria bacterium]